MFVIEDGNIKLTRGDTARITVALSALDGTEYEMQEGDTLTLTVRELADEAYEILTEVVSEDNVITLNNADTALAEPGKYSCDIQLTMASGERYTVYGADTSVVQPRFDNFWILPEVTMT